MASPFSIFRRNQKVLLAVVGLLAMIAFVFIGPWNVGGNMGAGEDPKIVTWNHGTIRSSDLHRMLRWRALINRFFSEAIGQEGMRPFPETEEAVIETMVLAKKAEEMGMNASDEAVNAFIRGNTGDQISREKLSRIISELRLDEHRRVTEGQFFDALRTELLAATLSGLVRQGLGGIPPGQRFEHYKRMNTTVKAQVLPVPVSQFLSQVPEPDDDQLKELYEAYKDIAPQYVVVQDRNLPSPEPAFKEPYRAKFNYFKANNEQFVALAAAKVTDQEIADYYEKNKRQFKVTPLPSADDKKPAGDAIKPAGGTPEKETTPKGDAAQMPAGAEPATSNNPFIELDAEKPDSGDAEAKPEAEKPEGTPPADQGAPSDTPFRVRGQDPETAADKDAAAPAGEGTTTASRPAGEGTTSAPPAAAAEQYEPLDKVRDVIRQRLAANRAPELIEKAFDQARQAIERHSDAVQDYKVASENDEEAEPPPDPKFATFAKQHGLTFAATDLLDGVSARNTELGVTFINAAWSFGDPDTFADLAFQSSQLYRPVVTQDIEDSRYLSFKTEQQDEHVPSFEAIRGKVAHAWKMAAARELARKEAEKLADGVRGKKEPLAKVFGNERGKEVREVGPFSWLTHGNVPLMQQGQMPSPRLSSIRGVDNAGPEFMQAALRLEPGQIGVAMNHPQTIAYVIQVTDVQPLAKVNRIEFSSTPYSMYYQAGGNDFNQAYQAWLNHVKAEAGLHWVQKPTAPGEES